MSLFGAMTTAVSGLSAQSAAFTNISDNVANSQTVGFKGVDTAFADYLTSSTATENQSGAVETTPIYQNDVQGNITQSTDPLAIAISGQGFFNVSQKSGTGSSTFNPQGYYTREGDFAVDQNGYLANASGAYLDGYNIDPTTGLIQTDNLAPIQIDTSPLPAVPSANVAFTASLPSTAGTATTSSSVNVFDRAGTSHALNMNWTQSTTNPQSWTLSFSSPDAPGGGTIGTANVVFNADGTMASITGDGTGVTGSASTQGSQATVTLNSTFGGSSQPLQIALGPIGSSTGTIMDSGTSYNPRTLTADGRTVGNYTGVSIDNSGDVTASYDNSQTRTIAHVPLTIFADPDALQRQNGQMFTATSASGTGQLTDENTNGAGQLVTGSVESSNVDIATNLTKLITAQQAYGANAKMITAADQMMQVTLQMKQ